MASVVVAALPTPLPPLGVTEILALASEPAPGVLPINATSVPSGGLKLSVGATLGAMPAGQLIGQLRDRDPLPPRDSLQNNVASAWFVCRLQLSGKLCGFGSEPIKLIELGAGANAEAPEPVMEQLPSVLVAALPLPVPPLGVTRMPALAGAPTAVPVPLRFIGVPTAG